MHFFHSKQTLLKEEKVWTKSFATFNKNIVIFWHFCCFTQIKSWTVLCTNRCGMQSILLRFRLKGQTHHATREGSKIKQKFAEHNDAFVELMETKVAPERWLPWQRSNKIFLLLFSLANLRDACQIKWQLMHKKSKQKDEMVSCCYIKQHLLY